MSKYAVVMTPKAEEDLEAVCDYISQDNPIKAIEFGVEFRVKIKEVL